MLKVNGTLERDCDFTGETILPLITTIIKLIECLQGSAAETMLERSGIGSEIITQNIIPDDPYQSIGDTDEARSVHRLSYIQYMLYPQLRRLTHNPSIEILPGTPAQSAPDYVLNPLSIFRMARKSIPERHAPERAASSSAANSTRPESVADLDQSAIENGDCIQANSTNDATINQGSLEELQNLFMSDLGWAWQPADTAVGSGIDGAGLLPWAGGYPSTQTEPWLPVFPFPQQE